VGKSVRQRPPGPPEILSLTAHPLRWRLLSELARSDRQVRELTARLDEGQSLVSYHLGRLRSGRLVRSRRSSADGRDAYDTADLASCASLLSAAGAALHPCLGLARPIAPATAVSGRVLFLCTGNSARSQMAEALLQHRTDNKVQAFSAGSRPARLHPNAVRVMRCYGIDLAGRRTKHFDEFSGERFDYVVTLCDRVREICPDFGGPGQAIHWSMPNPAEERDSDPATYPAFERTAAEISTRIDFFLPLLRYESEVL
jgi:ArsR family transcriptional regulator, arsenate/arsenite/antimonite-responsive transcriptional repressor / arsenate reductase (thioredoxin)